MTEPESHHSDRISRNVRITACVVGVGLVAWFFFAWLGLKRHVLDAAGDDPGLVVTR